MKTKPFSFLILFALTSFCFSSCTDADENPQEQQNTNPLPDFGDADGVMAAIKAKSNLPAGTPSIPGMADVLVDVANANFYSSPSGGSLVNVGRVSLNEFELQNVGGNAYLNNFSDITLEITPGQTNTWTVDGANGFSGFTFTTTKPMPGVVRFQSNVPEEFDLGSGVELSIQQIPSGVDNLLWVISDGNHVITKEGRSTSITFSESELNELSASNNALVQVAAYTSESQRFGGKKIYFINESVDSKFVTLK